MRIRRKLLYGVIICVSVFWHTNNVASIFLTSTLLTGFMGGYLIGRMNLGTFLSILSANQTATSSSPSLLSTLVSLVPVPREEENKAAAAPAPTVFVPTQPPYVFPNFVQPPQTIITVPVVQQPNPLNLLDTSLLPIRPVDVPVSLDNKIRDRFIRQLALMDPLNCLPKIFCEVSADPYGAAVALDHGTIAAIHPQASTITKEELIAHEYLLRRTTTTTTTTPRPTTPNVPASDTANDDNQSGSEEDVAYSDEGDSDEDDYSFEHFRNEEEHKIEMQALDEMVDEIDDPMMYYYILKDKQRKKENKKNYMKKQPFVDAVAYRDGGINVGKDVSHTVLNYDEPSMFINRRMGSNPPPPPPPLPYTLPRRPQLYGTTEASLSDMFSDDPFFQEFDSSTNRRGRSIRKRKGKRHSQGNDLMKKYRIAFMIAEKYRNQRMCSVAFPTCPYQTKTIMSVVNRLESGLLRLSGSSSTTNNNKKVENNIDQFQNTLLAIERLNKATLQAKERGGPFNIEKVAEVASSPNLMMDANTSQNIVQEFKDVVANIKSKMQRKKKNRRNKSKSRRKNYDAVHYYMKAQMENLKPQERISKFSSSNERQQDDEVQHSQMTWGDAPTFMQTYSNMFQTPKSSTTQRPKSKPTKIESSSKNTTGNTVKIFSEMGEDDEKDERDSEDAINMLIAQGKADRSPIV